jgi:hypothetical protein
MTTLERDPVPRGTFRAVVAVDLAQITYRQLDHWCRQGIVPADDLVVVGEGPGGRRYVKRAAISALYVTGVVSAAFADRLGGSNIPGTVLAAVYRAARDGAACVRLDGGVLLVWEDIP